LHVRCLGVCFVCIQVADFVGAGAYAARCDESQARVNAFVQRSKADSLPVFSMPGAVALGQQLNLHFFEPRYKLLIRRVWASRTRCFVYSPWAPVAGRPAALVRVDRVCFWPDGRASVVGRVVAAAVELAAVWVEDGTGGLACARLARESWPADDTVRNWETPQQLEQQQQQRLPGGRPTATCAVM
jgi:hypothetical protein